MKKYSKLFLGLLVLFASVTLGGCTSRSANIRPQVNNPKRVRMTRKIIAHRQHVAHKMIARRQRRLNHLSNLPPNRRFHEIQRINEHRYRIRVKKIKKIQRLENKN